MNTHNLFWIVPFLISITTYGLFNLFIPRQTIIAPSVIGKPLHEALSDLSSCGLNTRIVSYKQDDDLPEGTIISQSPRGKKQIKPGQTILIAVSKQSPPQYAPTLQNYTEDDIIKKLKTENFTPKFFNVISPYPNATCVAQVPAPHTVLTEKTIICYISRPHNDFVIFPDLKGHAVADVNSFLEQHGIPVTITHTKTISAHHQCTHCTVSSQKPLPGSIISRKKLPQVQIHI